MADGNGLSGMPPDRDGVRRAVLVSSIAVAVIAASALGAWALWFRGDARTSEPGDTPSYEHAQPTTSGGSAEPTTSGSAGSNPAMPTAPGGDPSAEPSAAAPAGAPLVSAATRRPYVAYRLAGKIVVAREDGSSPKPIATSASGVFSLSPDARTLALVDFSAGKLVLVDVGTLSIVSVGRAAQAAPVWAPDSGRLLFVRDNADHSQDVYQVSQTGAGAKSLGSASRAAFSPDGRVVALAASALASSEQAAKVVLLQDGKPWRTLDAPGAVTDLALGVDRAFAAVAPGTTEDGGPAEGVWVLAFDATAAPVRLAQPGGTGERGVLGALSLSPNTLHLAYARAGDDGYSRMEIVPTAGGTPVTLSTRKDAYPIGWSADSRAAFFIEGNAWQGETTALARIRADGTGRAVVVSGAGR